MLQHSRILIGLALLGLLFALRIPALAQGDKPDLDAINKRRTQELLDKARDEYRIFFKKPETGLEFWSAIKFEMDLGKFDLAAYHLKLMLEKDEKQVNADLVKIEELEGMSAFFRLQAVRPKDWSDHEPFQKDAVKSVDTLIERVTKAVETHLSDPDRIRKFIKNLDAPTPEERGYAYVQLARSRERAMPYLIDAIRTNNGKTLFPKLRETLIRMPSETVPVYLEAFKAANDKDYRDVEMRLTLLDIAKQRDDKRVIPYLWHMYASKRYPDAVRKKAKETLASLLRTDIDNVPPAKEALTELAERYYQHRIDFHDKALPVYEWDGDKIVMPAVKLTPYQAEEFFGMRYAKEALDLDPSWWRAQLVYLSLLLERQYRPKMDQILLEPMPPKMQELLTTIDADLAMRVLERGMEDHQIAVVLPLIQALGERGEIRAARLQAGGQARGVVKALYYPDRRVQFAAVRAMLQMPPATSAAVASERVVEVSRRFLASDFKSKALVVAVPQTEEQPVRGIVSGLGFEPVLAKKPAEAADKAKANADFDLVILHRGLSEADFSVAYGQLRKNFDTGGLPMLIVVEKSREKSVRKFTARDPNVLVISEDRFKADDELKDALDKLARNAFVVKLSPAERKAFAKASLDTLWRMARGEIKGYDVTPAVDTLFDRLNSKDYAVAAVEILGRLPGKQIQFKLAGIVTDPGRDQLRLPAAVELNRHIQTNGVLIDEKQVADLKAAQAQAGEGTPLRAQLNVTASLIARTTAAKTGSDLSRFRPDAPAAPKEKKGD